METAASRRPILKKNVEAFVPSPRFLSESPVHQLSSAKPTSLHISPNVASPSPSVQLHSPVPPPPANLFGGNPGAFNVDPGAPFLGTAGPSDAGDSDKGSISEFESPKRTVGAFVTGLKKALTVRRSQRKSPIYQQQEETYPAPLMVRDSGYATSDRLEEPLATQPPPLTTFSPSPPPTQYFPLTTPSDYHTTNDHGHDAPSIDSLVSAVTALVEYGPDYMGMARDRTPPQSDVSFNTYMFRFQKFVHDLAGLPWMASDRVTVDYYPSAAERIHKRFSHRPFITWRSKDYYPPSPSETDSLTLQMTPHPRLRAQSHASRSNFEIDPASPERTWTRLPFPFQPQSIPQTPDYRRLRSELEGMRSDLGEVKFPSPPHASDPIPNPTEWSYPNRENALNTLSLYPPNSGQTPNMRYPEESLPEWRNDANPKTPSARRYSLVPAPLTSSNTGRAHGEDPRLRSRNANATLSTHRPDSSNHWWESTPKSEYSRPTPETAPSNRPPKPRSGQQPISGSPSRPSHKSHTTSRRPRRESTEEWEEDFVRERTGYVPFEFSENFYGDRYGTGIHGLLPPVGRAASSGTSIAPSIKQPQPQYPMSALVTPPSRPGSL